MPRRGHRATRVVVAGVCLSVCLGRPIGGGLAASDLDEFKVKREAVFQFAEKPVVTRQGDRVTIEFETQGFCDVTVAIEAMEDGPEKGAGTLPLRSPTPFPQIPAPLFRSRIIRHLASGVLGPNAPDPLQKNTKRQVLFWDGKDDQGAYVDDKDRLTVRVSLGLKPQFERTLFWSPHKRIAGNTPLFAPAPEGVYVFEGCGLDSIRLYDHEGNFLRTVYPFPADKLAEVQGLDWREFPQDGQRLPLKHGPKHMSTLFTTGSNVLNPQGGKGGQAASAFAVQGTRIALASHGLGRMATDGTSGGLPIGVPEAGIALDARGKPLPVLPRGAAFSPDGRWLYLTGYPTDERDWLHAVVRVDYAKAGRPAVFVGSLKPRDSGADSAHLNVPTSVACDAAGNVYVADYMNDRVQVFTPDAWLLKSIPAAKPAKIGVHPSGNELYVASWMLVNRSIWSGDGRVEPRLTRLTAEAAPKVLGSYPLPLHGHNPTANFNRYGGLQFEVAFDFHTSPPTVWLAPGLPERSSDGQGSIILKDWKNTGVRLMVEQDGKLITKRDFGADVERAVARVRPAFGSAGPRQRLYVHPRTGLLYVGEADCGDGKAFNQLVEIDPATGRSRLLDLPMATEDLAIGLDGLFYLRSDLEVARFDPATWTEVPWDYGEERKSAGFGSSGARMTPLVAGLVLPALGRPSWWHMGGMAISPTGHLAVTCHNAARVPDRLSEGPFASVGRVGYEPGARRGGQYTPTLYPGRAVGWETHIWDERGRLVREDALRGLTVTDGLGLDKDDNLYVLVCANRVLDGRPYFLSWNETLVKVPPRSGFKAVTASDRVPIPLGKEGRPGTRPPVEMWGHGAAWLEGAEWFYGGVGFCGGSCICWNARPALGLFARSFVPEIDHFSVAVLDTNGNLILRIGKYGNAEDGKPLIEEGGPANARSIGGDEVALFHAAYLSTHTDHRLFISDGGNSRILSVKLDYHATERIPLKGVSGGKNP